MERLHVAWRRFLDELEQRAPVTRRAIRPPRPSTDDDSRLPIALNDELRAWFRLHDGCEPGNAGWIFPFNAAEDLSAAVESTLFRRQIWQADRLPEDADLDELERRPPGTVARTWLDSYVTLTRDGMGGGLFVDLRPGLLRGCVRWWDKVDADDDHEVAGTSVTALLADVTRSLRSGAPVAGWAPRLADGILTWKPADRGSMHKFR